MDKKKVEQVERLLVELGLRAPSAESVLKEYAAIRRGWVPFRMVNGNNPLEIARRNPNKDVDCLIDFPQGAVEATVCYFPAVHQAVLPDEKVDREANKAERRYGLVAAPGGEKKKTKGKERQPGTYIFKSKDKRKPTSIRVESEAADAAFAPVHESGRIPEFEELHTDLNAVCSLEYREEEIQSEKSIASSAIEPTSDLAELEQEDLFRLRNDFDYLLARYQKVVLNSVSCSVNGHQSDAEDITQETFITAFRRIQEKNFRIEISFRAWLLRIAFNYVKQHWRNKQRRARRGAGGGASIDTPIAKGLTMGDLIEAPEIGLDLETVWEIEAAIAELNQRDQNIIRLHHFNDPKLSWAKIAEIMGESVAAVKLRHPLVIDILRNSLHRKLA